MSNKANDVALRLLEQELDVVRLLRSPVVGYRPEQVYYYLLGVARASPYNAQSVVVGAVEQAGVST